MSLQCPRVPSDLYSGPVFALSTPGRRIVVLSNLANIAEGLEKRACADRPRLVVVGELMGFDQVRPRRRSQAPCLIVLQQPVLLPEGKDHRMTRKVAHAALNAQALAAFAGVQRDAVARCVVGLGSAEDFAREIKLHVHAS